MGKMHTREKRKKGLSRVKPFKSQRFEQRGAKTFPDEESAKEWAEEYGVEYDAIESAKHGRRVKLVREDGVKVNSLLIPDEAE